MSNTATVAQPAKQPALVPTLTYKGVNYHLNTGVCSIIIDILFSRDVLSSARFVELYGSKIKPADLSTQLEGVKKFWNDQIAELGPSSIDIRDELYSQTDACRWLDVFDKHASKLVGSGLPKRPTPPNLGLTGMIDGNQSTLSPV